MVSDDTRSGKAPGAAAAAVADGDKLAVALSFPIWCLVIVDGVALHGWLVLHTRLRSIQVQATKCATEISYRQQFYTEMPAPNIQKSAEVTPLTGHSP